MRDADREVVGYVNDLAGRNVIPHSGSCRVLPLGSTRFCRVLQEFVQGSAGFAQGGYSTMSAVRETKRRVRWRRRWTSARRWREPSVARTCRACWRIRQRFPVHGARDSQAAWIRAADEETAVQSHAEDARPQLSGAWPIGLAPRLSSVREYVASHRAAGVHRAARAWRDHVPLDCRPGRGRYAHHGR
jgi:hypothetical protein